MERERESWKTGIVKIAKQLKGKTQEKRAILCKVMFSRNEAGMSFRINKSICKSPDGITTTGKIRGRARNQKIVKAMVECSLNSITKEVNLNPSPLARASSELMVVMRDRLCEPLPA